MAQRKLDSELNPEILQDSQARAVLAQRRLPFSRYLMCSVRMVCIFMACQEVAIPGWARVGIIVTLWFVPILFFQLEYLRQRMDAIVVLSGNPGAR